LGTRISERQRRDTKLVSYTKRFGQPSIGMELRGQHEFSDTPTALDWL
jgi:hypothetical protein